jgi:hypothetical protein
MHSVCRRERAECQYVARSQPTAVVATDARVRKETASPEHARHLDASLEGEDAEASAVGRDRAGLPWVKAFGGASIDGEPCGLRDLERHRAEDLESRGVRFISDGKMQRAKA